MIDKYSHARSRGENMSRTELHRRRVVIGLITGATLISLAGCGSSSSAKSATAPGAAVSTSAGAATADAAAPPAAGAPTGAPGKAGKGSADVTFSGVESGSIKAADSTCTVIKGELESFQAPSDQNAGGPSVAGVQSGTGWMMPVSTAAHVGGYVKNNATGVKATKTGDSWTVTLTNTEVAATYDLGQTVTLNGTIVCGQVVSAG
ncbi:hypothetical protein AB0O82_07820 [Kitasatospora sp. NPDC088264]|uniref:hypothetical protein n=1 Tax=Kitasatospora sp. NPDC088264 TaxID=3155296 RepID=UPI00343DA589